MSNWKRNISLFLSSQSISLFGSAIVQYAIMWHITLTTQSGVMMMIYIICGFLPTFFLSPFAGVWADRYSRKLLIMIADGLIAFSTLILAILYLAGYQELWLLFLIAAIRACGAAIQSPAVGAVLPQLVPEDQLLRINGVNGSLQAAITFIAPMISAALISITTLEMIFFIDVITALLAIVVLLFLNIKAVSPAELKSSYLEDFKAGITFVKNQPYLKNLLVISAVLFFLMAPAVFLTPLQVTRTFGEDVWYLTAIEIAFSIGMMLGGALLAIWGGMKNHIHTVVIGGIIFSLCTIGFGLIPSFFPYIVAMCICGLAMPLFNSPVMTIVQEKVPADYLGRVFGIMSMISSAMLPMGMLVFGPLADYVDIELLFIITGICMLTMIFFIGTNKPLVEAGIKHNKQLPATATVEQVD